MLKRIPDESIDALITDPPYELGFMGKSWDSTGIAYNVELWKECLRVLKPGGYLLSFGGTRTYHRMACAIEDAGFEIRDQIMWVYGSGFPKSYDISKGIDKKLGVERTEVIGKSNSKGIRPGSGNYIGDDYKQKGYAITIPATEQAKQWNGWGTALKPAHEPIVVARKPLSEKTVVENVLKWSTGGINIDECRVNTREKDQSMSAKKTKNIYGKIDLPKVENKYPRELGRFPANVIFDEEAGKMLDEQSNNASRFFYCAKASKKERGEYNNHPTVKPLSLMQYLVRLVTTPNGIVLDPFSGSGTTAIAALRTGRYFIGIEKEHKYVEITKERIAKERTVLA